MIHVCPLSRVVDVVRQSGASRLISLLAPGADMTRPAAIAPEDHLWLGLNDIAEARHGMVLAGERQVSEMLAFGRAWDRQRPLVIHCFAGVSRSTACAYIIGAALAPERDEFELASTLRRLSPTATPNPRLIELADTLLGRKGRMVEAIRLIGRGADAFEGEPFVLRVSGE